MIAVLLDAYGINFDAAAQRTVRAGRRFENDLHALYARRQLTAELRHRVSLRRSLPQRTQTEPT
jgi:hypothetical protein